MPENVQVPHEPPKTAEDVMGLLVPAAQIHSAEYATLHEFLRGVLKSCDADPAIYTVTVLSELISHATAMRKRIQIAHIPPSCRGVITGEAPG